MSKAALWIIAGSCALLALGFVVLPFGMGVAAGMNHDAPVAAEAAPAQTADEVFKSVADSL